VHDRAQALRFADIERFAKRSLTEGGMHSVRKREIEAAMADEFDGFFSTLSGETLERMARDSCEMLSLPFDRLSNVLDGLRCEVAGAVERRTWCRHLRVLERAPPGPAFRYLRPPERCCTCQHLRYQSHVTGTDWTALTAAFKRTYCAGCPARDPRDGNAPRSPSA
jgi:hypothetical protein